MNNKFFSNLHNDSRDTLKFAETKSSLWTEAQVLNTHRTAQHIEEGNGVLQMVHGKIMNFFSR